MALLLLDNAVELLAQRAIEWKLWFNRGSRRIEKNVKWWAPDEARDELLRSLGETIIDKETEKDLRRLFDEKLKFLEEGKHIETSTRRALSVIHRYRNEAY
jgi:hypothetical protein